METICLVTDELCYVTEYTGGIGVTFNTLAGELSDRGYSVTVVLCPRCATVPVSGYDRNYNLVVLDVSMSGKMAYISRSIAIDRWLTHNPQDIVIAPDWGGLAFVYSARRRRGRVVTNLVTSLRQVRMIESGELGNSAPVLSLSDRLRIRMEDIQTLRSDGVVAISRSILDWTESLMATEFGNSEVIGNPVDVSELEQLDASREVPAGYRDVVYMGRVSYWKGADVVVDAMVRLWSEGFQDVRLFVVGDESSGGEFISKLRVAAGEYRDRITFTGHVSRDRALSILSCGVVGLFPSRYEGFGNVALESMAVGTPAVVTSGHGFDDFCVHDVNSVMIQAGDATGLSAALRAVLSDSSYAISLAEGGRVTASSYSASSVGEHWVRYMQSLSDSIPLTAPICWILSKNRLWIDIRCLWICLVLSDCRRVLHDLMRRLVSKRKRTT